MNNFLSACLFFMDNITWYLYTGTCINYIHYESNIASSFSGFYLETFDQLLNM